MRLTWGEKELADLMVMSWDEFRAAYPHRGFDSWRNQRHRQGAHASRFADGQDVTKPAEPAAVPRPALPEPEVTDVVGVMAREDPDVEEIRRRHSLAFRRQQEVAERKRFQHISISHGPAMIALVSDVHIGSPQCDLDRAYREQEVINNTPGAHVFLLGDVVDNFVVGRLRDQNMSHTLTIPDEWVLFEDYVNRWRNLRAFVMGNHDKWSISQAGADLHRRLIHDGAVLYDTDDMRLTVNVGSASVLFRLRHKVAGSSQYNKTHGQEKSILFDDPRPDIVVAGHSHAGALCREMTHNGRRKLAIQLGSYKVDDPYAIQEGLPMTDHSTAAAVIIMPSGEFIGMSSLSAACSFMQAVYRGAA